MTRRLLLIISLLAAAAACGDDDDGTGGDGGGMDGGGTDGGGTDGGGTDGGADGGAADGGATDGGATDAGPDAAAIDGADITVQTPTFHSIGLILDLEDDVEDTDYDAVVSVRYRKRGDASYSTGMPLVRQDYTWFYLTEMGTRRNGFAGSLMFLTPGTTYEIVLTYRDPDGVEPTRVGFIEATTRAIPEKPTGGNTYYVVPGSGSGNAGTPGDPFEGIAEANAAAAPGDVFLLRSGTYADSTLDASGSEGDYIVYQEDPADPDAIIESFAIEGDHIWIDGLTFVWDGTGTDWYDTSAIYIPPPGRVEPDDVVVTGNDFSGFMNTIRDFYGTSRWIVVDNTMVGAEDVGVGGGPTGSFNGEGVELGRPDDGSGGGHVIAYNSITRFADGVYGSEGSDVYGNQIWDIADDAVENDASYENVRVWGNRLSFCAGSSISFQPQRASPWYFLYNQMTDAGNGIWKFRVTDRIVFVNNTFVGGTLQGQHFMRGILRNNLFIDSSPPIWNSTDESDRRPTLYREPLWTAGWQTDVDYDGFDRGGSGPFFLWEDNTTPYSSLAEFAAAVGIESNAVEVDADAIFEDFTISPTHSLVLASGANAAVDAGEAMPNIADFYEGSAPDLGAYERDADALHFGPRAGGELIERANHWTKH